MRLALVRLSVAGILAAIAVGTPQTWRHLGRERAHLSPREADVAAARHERLPVEQFRRWKARLGRGDRWWLDVPAGSPQGLTTRGAVYRAFATYYFLPAVPATSRRDATVVFRVGRAR